MAEFWLGASPITWNNSEPFAQTLPKIAKVGFVGAPAGYQAGADPVATQAVFASCGLRPAPGYLGANFHVANEREQILDQARLHADFARALGCGQLFVAEHTFAARNAVAGHETANRQDQLSAAGYQTAADTLNRVGEICRERGVQACFHNHAGSYVETRDELDRVLSLTDPALVFVGLDTGHLAYGGGDVADFCRANAPRIKALHLKDVNPAVLTQARAQKWTYRQAQDHGLWAELGEGLVDFPSSFASLRAAGYTGWVIAEIDRTMLPTPLDSIRHSYAYLRRLIGSDS